MTVQEIADPQVHSRPTHEHVWQLQSVDFAEGGVAVQEYSCAMCSQVWFR